MAVAQELVTRLKGSRIPLNLKSFLCNAWKDVLVLAWLRRNKDPGNWSHSIELMDQLIAGTDTSHGPISQGYGDASAIAVLEMMKECLSNLANYEQYSIMELTQNKAESWQNESRDDCCSNSHTVSSASSEEHLVVKDPEISLLIKYLNADYEVMENVRWA